MQQGIKFRGHGFYSDLMSPFHTILRLHTAYSGIKRPTSTHNYILPPPDSRWLYVLHWMNNSLISKIYLTYQVYSAWFSKITHLQKSETPDLNKLTFEETHSFLRNTKMLIEMVSGTEIPKHATRNVTLRWFSRDENE